MDPYLQELAKAGISSATKVLLEKALGLLTERKFDKGKALIEELLMDDNYTNFLTRHVSRTIKIRTIHSEEKDIYLNDIYHSLSMRNMENNNIIRIKDDTFIENDDINNIIGYAGQGKSTILRKLFIEQLKNGSKIPFFIELSKAEKSGVLKQLEFILIECGIKTNEEKLDNLLSSGQVLLLLDGFDEVSPQKRREMINEITSIHRKNGTQIITTTRPDTEICHETNISNYKVEKLRKADILAIIKKLNSSTNYLSSDLVTKVNNILSDSPRLIGVMNLPILVTLFYVCYPMLDKTPRNSVDFYEKLFATLYLRHDKVKNLERHKSSDVPYAKAYEVFCALSFMSLYDNQNSFNEISLYDFVSKSMSVSSIDIKENPPEKLVSDFINVTCLIQKDGYDRFVYLHKSVQEYHASEFIKKMKIDKKEKFYGKILQETVMSSKFSNVIRFLTSTDEDDVIEKLIIPLCEMSGVNNWQSPSDKQVECFINDVLEQSSIEMTAIVKNKKIISKKLSLSDNKYGWISIFDYSGNVRSRDSLIDVIFECIFKISNSYDTDYLDSLGIAYGKTGEDEDKEGVSATPIPTNKFVKDTGMMENLISPVKSSMQETFKTLYSENKEKLERKNKNLESYFDFL